jgi:hypothetical protein
MTYLNSENGRLPVGHHVIVVIGKTIAHTVC